VVSNDSEAKHQQDFKEFSGRFHSVVSNINEQGTDEEDVYEIDPYLFAGVEVSVYFI
jgi:hypothetical protein